MFRDDPSHEVVAFTGAQIPGIDRRTYPASLAGPLYPHGVPVQPESRLSELIAEHGVDEVVLAYSDLSHEQVMHLASEALCAGADFRLLSPRSTALRSRKPVVAVCAVRTGAGKSPTSRYVAELIRQAGLSVVMVRHPMAYGDLEAMRCQRFATLADIDAAHPTVEEREEYEEPVRRGILVYAGVDYGEILARAEAEADVVLWDGGNNDAPFFAPDLLITVADALRPGHEVGYHPGEVNVRAADIVAINKVDSADGATVAAVEASVRALNPRAEVVKLACPVVLDAGPDLTGRRVLVVEDGPTLTHGGMSYGAGTVAARSAGAVLVDPRPYAVGTLAEVYRRYPSIGPVLPAMGYSPEQAAELEATIRAADCDTVVSGTPCDLARVVRAERPVRRASYAVAETGSPGLRDLLSPYLARFQPGLWTFAPAEGRSGDRRCGGDSYTF